MDMIGQPTRGSGWVRLTRKGVPVLVRLKAIDFIEPSETGVTLYFGGSDLPISVDETISAVHDFICVRGCA